MAHLLGSGQVLIAECHLKSSKAFGEEEQLWKLTTKLRLKQTVRLLSFQF
jgi:hypothetical protein